jgi:glutamate dehydrogenase
VATQPFTAVGIGDMSGDVFGNGMLLAPHMRLIAAFDHRHVFLDPNPDAPAALAERRRLFDLSGSSWDDYDRGLISQGGGVWPRSAKAVPVSPQARVALGVDAESLTPTELIQAILRAPVDLLWNGGIGTYVKSTGEEHDDVGDRANDAVRISGRELRASVVGEGGNLGFTQLGRIEYAQTGGRINTDAIDNSGGVDCSDHEVNLKILLAQLVEDGALSTEERNALLRDVAADVVEHVLYDNYLQVQILSQESAASPLRLEAYEDLMVELERAGLLERSLEYLPSAQTMAERAAAGQGMVRPELCVLLAYAKRLLRRQVLDSQLPDDPWLGDIMREYFPQGVVERFGDALDRHPLRRELIATIVTNDVVNAMGVTFLPRLAAETGGSADDIARAFLVAREISDARSRWAAVEALDRTVPADVQSELMDGVDAMVDQLARWYLHHVPHPDLSYEIERGRDGFAELLASLDDAGTGGWRTVRDARLAELHAAGVPDGPARFAAAAPQLIYAPDVIAVARSSERTVGEVAHAFFVIGERLFLDAIERRVSELPGTSRWQRLAWVSMVDDLRLLRRQIVERVIAQGAGKPIDAATERYLDARIDPYERLAALMESPSADGADEASVIIHQIRQVVSS